MSSSQIGSASAAGGDARSEAERNFAWNAAWFTVDYLTFSVGMAFLNQSTVLPTFVSQLTDSDFLVGLVATIQSGAWLLPQLVGASLVAGKPRKRLYMIVPAAVGRPTYVALAALIAAVGAGSPLLLLTALYATMAVFGMADAMCSVSWFDILSKAIPARRRGRLLGTAQVVSGLAGIAVGALVGYVLARPDLPFPRNYAALFTLGGAAYLLGLVALSMIREPAGPAQNERKSLGAFLAMVRPALREDRRFARVVAIRLAFGAGALVFPFYIVYAEKVLTFGPEHVGLFLSAQVGGGMLGGFLLGQVADHRGISAAIRVAIPIAGLAPGLALVTHLAGPALGPLLFYVMAAVFVAVGVTFSSYMLCFMNYVLEIAPSDDRSTYAGLFNTVVGVLLVVPALAGWFLGLTSYQALFGVALLLLGAAWVGSLWLPEPRAARAQVTTEA